MDTCRSCNQPLPPGYNLGLICSSCVDSLRPTGGLKYDAGKLRYSLIPPEATHALAEVLTFGAQKYAKDNWKLLENGKERYLDALYRHLEAYRTGEYLDSESNLPHLSHCLCNLAFIHFFETQDRKL